MANNKIKLSITVMFIEVLWITLMLIALETIFFDYENARTDRKEYTLHEINGYTSSSIRIAVEENNKTFLIQGNYRKLIDYTLLEDLNRNEQITILTLCEEPLFYKLSWLFNNVTVVKLWNEDNDLIFDMNNSVSRYSVLGLMFYFIFGWGIVLLIITGWVLYFSTYSKKYEHLLEHPLVRYKLEPTGMK